MKQALVICIFILIIPFGLNAQGDLVVPDASQKAGVSQRIGLTDMAINYHSPLVKGRTIWGELVPFGEIWRAGANENTTISFSTPVSIDGKNLSAGTYGMFIIPRKDKWTIIFSSNFNSWGSYFYDPAEDVLRVDVTPESAPMQEWLSYKFTDIKAASVKIAMNWEKISVGFLVEVKVPESVFQSMRNELRGDKGFSWEALWQAADYCERNNIYTDAAIKWVNESIALKETFQNLNTKSQLLSSLKLNKEAEELKSKALSVATETELNAYGYQLLGSKQIDEAVDVFKMNVHRNPGSWNAYDSLAEALETKGDAKNALSNYQLAYKKAPEGQKKRIKEAISKIEKNVK